jgi:capsular polysaccharide biosynthesis protein
MQDTPNDKSGTPLNKGNTDLAKSGKKGSDSSEEYILVPADSYYSDEDRELVDIIGLLKDLWVHKATILLITAIFFTIGIISYVGSERIYYSETKVIPENTSSSSRVGQLFQQYESFFGIQRGGDESDISVSMYPYIVESMPFQIELMQREVYFESLGREVTIFDYFNEYHEKSFTQAFSDNLWDYTIGLPLTIYNGIRSIGSDASARPDVRFSDYTSFEVPVKLDNRVRTVAKTVSEMTTITREPQSGFIIIGVSMPDPRAASEMVILIKDLLKNYVIEYRTEKSMKNLLFIEEQFEEAEQNFLAVQDSLAEFQDRNVNINLRSFEVIEQRLQSEYELAFGLYNTLARRLQEAKIEVQEETPVFRVQEPAVIPGTPSSPSELRTLGGSLFVGLFMGVLFIYVRRLAALFLKKFKSKEPKPYFS